jgi:hypothetical protein
MTSSEGTVEGVYTLDMLFFLACIGENTFIFPAVQDQNVSEMYWMKSCRELK